MAENEESFESSIVDQRDELMVDLTSYNANQNPTLRTSYFLKPTLNPDSTPPTTPKIQPFSLLSKPNVVYHCHLTPLKGWKTWVENLEVIHEQAWRKAGIFDAVKGSTCHFGKESDLIFKLAERWCPETNTFVFPWGEATVTLEDIYVLGGFSPLGALVLGSCSSVGENAIKVENKLRQSYKKLLKIHKNLSHLRWQEHFMGCGKQIEYAAFLSLWLARHVLPTRSPLAVTRSVFSLASKVSCGVKFAFAQPILASIYRDLTLLNRMIVDCASGDSVDGSPLKLLSPIHLVQVWAWERFPSLGAIPRTIKCRETRLARWEHCCSIDDVGSCLDLARETFRWRPYAISLEGWSFPRFYVDLGMWVVLDCDASDDDLNIIARCLIACKLLGFHCIEWYNPHRVALQFGFDQDIPKFIDRSEANGTFAWVGNKKDLQGLKLYIPPRLHEGDVTYRYSNWWMTQLNVQEEVQVGSKRKRTRKKVKKLSKICEGRNEFEIRNIAESVRVNPMEKSSHREELSSQYQFQVSNEVRMTCLSNVPNELFSQENINVEEVGEIEVNNPTVTGMKCVRKMQSAPNLQEGTWLEKDKGNKANNHSSAECSKYSDGNYSLNQAVIGAKTLTEHESNNPCRKLAVIDLNRGEDQDGIMNVVCPCAPCNDAVCSYCAAKHLNLAREARQVMIASPMVRAEGGSEKSLVEHGEKMEENSGYLEVDIPQTEAPTERNGTLLGVAIEAEPHEALCPENPKYLEGNNPQMKTPTECNGTSTRVACEDDPNEALYDHTCMNVGNVPANSQVSVSDEEDNRDDNSFERLCLEFEKRISKRERQISALLAAYVRSTRQ